MSATTDYKNFRSIVQKALLAILAIGAFGISHQAAAAPLVPQIDFRSGDFSGADGQHSFGFNFDDPAGMPVNATISAFRDGDGEEAAANLWWDSMDGFGVRGQENDEVDSTEFIRLEFSKTIGLSHIFFADLFSGETHGGRTYNEAGAYQTDGGLIVEFDANQLAGTFGTPGNGEAALILDKTIPVNSLTLRGAGELGYDDFAVLGFTDPVHDVPEPGILALFGTGLIGLGVVGWRRRKA